MNTETQFLQVNIRPASIDDLQKVIDLDAEITGLEKKEYWENHFNRFAERNGRYLMIAESKTPCEFLGFIVGEVSGWEFGSRPCGWVFVIGVAPSHRVQGIGEKLFNAMCEVLKADGADSVRTMVGRDDQLNMSFFRSQGMMAGPFIELEKPLF